MDEHDDSSVEAGTETSPKPAQLDALRGAKDRRVNLGAVVRDGPEHIPVSDVDMTIPHGYKRPGLSDLGDWTPEQWRGLKVERNAIAAVMISDAWPQLLADIEQHKAAGSDLGLLKIQYTSPARTHMEALPYSVQQIQDPTNDLQAAAKRTFELSLQTWGAQKEHIQQTVPLHEQTRMDAAFARLEQIIDFGNEHGDTGDDGTARMFIERGISTATSAMWRVLEVIPKVYEQELRRPITVAELRAIAKNSYPLILRLAAGNSELSIPVLHALEDASAHVYGHDKPYDSKHFMISGEGDQASVEITQQALDSLQDSFGNHIMSHTVEADTTGCPAMHAKTPDGKNVIEAMWEWSLELAEKGYFPMYEQAPEEAQPEDGPEVVGQDAAFGASRAFLKRALTRSLRNNTTKR